MKYTHPNPPKGREGSYSGYEKVRVIRRKIYLIITIVSIKKNYDTYSYIIIYYQVISFPPLGRVRVGVRV